MLLELTQSQLAAELTVANEAIIDLLAAMTRSTDYDAVVADWPHPSTPPPAKVDAVLQLPESERVALWEAVRGDVEFEASLDDEKFAFRFAALPVRTKDAGKRLLVWIYEVAFGQVGFSLPTHRPANRRAWETAFRDANSTVKVCPACLFVNLEERIDDRAAVDLDHYLPKSIYPSLAVHGLNLVPLCVLCNRVAKRGKDPLTTAAISDIWFPYRRAGINDLIVRFSLAAASRDEVVQISAVAGAEARASCFDELFELSGRWSRSLSGIHDSLVGLVKATVEDRSDRDPIARLLRRLAATMKSEQSVTPAGYLSGCYCDCLAADPDALTAFIEEVSA